MADRETGWFRGAGGVTWQMDLPLPENMADQLLKGYLTRVNEDGSPYEPDGVEPEAELPPAANASKAHWVGYVVRAHGLSPDDAEAMTRNDLIEKYGAA